MRRILGRPVVMAAAPLVLVGAIALGVVLTDEPPPAPGCTRLTPDVIGSKRFDAPPCRIVDRDHVYIATILTSAGPIRMQLEPRLGVNIVNNFVFLARAGFYDGTTFHKLYADPRVSIALGGDPTGTGTGGPGYRFTSAEPPSPVTRYLVPGLIAMWRFESGEISGSQFFIVARPTDLPPHYPVFGRVDCARLEPKECPGLASLERMLRAGGSPLPDGSFRPATPIKIVRVTVQEHRRSP